MTIGTAGAIGTISDISKSTDEDTTLTFAAADFTGAFSDPDGHTLKSVKIVTLPDTAHGTLKSGNPLTARSAGDSIPAADLGTLVFEPVANWNGTASFTFKVTGTDDQESSAAATVTITVRPQAVTVAVADAAATEGSAVTFKATLSAAVSSNVVLGWSTGDDDTTGARRATADTDYTAVSNGSVTIAANQTEATFTVSTTQDTATEGDETFKVTITGTTLPAGVTIATASAIGTITGDDGVTVAVADAAATEGSAVTFKATLSAAVSSNVVLGWSTGNDDTAGARQATAGTDYTAVSGGSVTIAANSTEATFTVSTTADTDTEGDETFKVTITGTTLPAGVTIGTASAVGTITGDDGVTVAVADASATEGSAVTFKATLSAAVSSNVVLGWSTGNDDTTGARQATADTDYTAVSGGSVTITANQTEATFTVSTTQDTTTEGDETFKVTITGTTVPAGVAIGTASAVGTITGDDGVTVSVADASATEGSAVTFKATLSAAVSSNVVLGWSTGNDDTAGARQATAGTDYTAVSGGSVTIAANSTEATFTVSTTADTDTEGDETFKVTITGTTLPAGVTIGTASAVGTITGDDGVTVAVADAAATEGSAVTFKATLSAAVSSNVVLGWSTGNDDTTGARQATADTDYTAVSGGSVTITANQTEATFTVSTTQDTATEGDETFKVTISETTANPLPAGVTIGTASAIGTITGDDGVTVAVADAAATEGSAVTFKATLSAAVSSNVVLGWSTGNDDTAGARQATAGTDYTAVSNGSVTIAANSTEATFTVQTTQDTTIEGDETFKVTISETTANPLPAGVTIATASAIGTITGDDGVAVSVADAAATEGSAVTFKATLSAAVSSNVVLGWSTGDDDTAGARQATAGTDYTAVSNGSVTIAANSTEATFTVQTTQDTATEGDETFKVTITGTTLPAGVAIGTASAVGTITGDDGVTVAVTDAAATEGSAVTFKATLSSAVSSDVVLGWSTGNDDTAGARQATAGTDYTAVPNGSVTISAGRTEERFPVSTTADTTIEGDETFKVTIAGTTLPDGVTIGTASAIGTIVDDDPPPPDPPPPSPPPPSPPPPSQPPPDPTPPNSAPTSVAGADQAVLPGVPVTLDGSASSDPDGHTLTFAWSQTAGEPVTLTGAATARPSFVAPWQPGDLVFELTVTDPGGLSASDTVIVTVRDLAPEFGTGGVPPLALVQGRAIEPVVLPAANGGNGVLGYRLTSEPAGLAGLAFDPATRTLSGTPTTVGSYAFTYRADDADATRTDADAALLTFAVTVHRPNRTPTPVAGADQAVLPGVPVTLDGSASSDPDGHTLAFAWSQTAGEPVTLTGAATARPSFVAPWQPGDLVFELTVTDPGGLSASDTVIVTVRDLAPEFDTGGVPPLALVQGRAIEPVVLPAASGGNGVLGYRLTSEPAGLAGLAFDPATRTLSGTPTTVGSFAFTYRADDADATRTDADAALLTFAVTVHRPNRTPTPVAGADQAVLPGVPVTLDGSASSDPDGHTLAFAWSQTAGEPVTLTGAATARPSFVAPWQPGDLVFELTVTDPGGLSASDTVIVTVRDLAPEFDTGGVPPLALVQGRAVEPVVLPAASGGNGVLGYRLTSEPAGLAGLAFDPATRTLSGTPTTVGSYAFTYRADDADATRTDADAALLTFAVTVRNAPPAAVIKRTLAAIATRSLAIATDTLGARLTDHVPATSVTTAGQRLPLDAAPALAGCSGAVACGDPFAAGPATGRLVDAEELLRSSDFSWTLAATDENDPRHLRLSLWGRGDLAAFAGRPQPGSSYEGRTWTGWLGADVRSGPWVAGGALLHAVSATEYEADDGAGARGRLETTLTAFYPYGRWTLVDGLDLRALFGIGAGDLRLAPDGGEPETSGLSMWMGSIGVRQAIPAVAGIALVARGDASFARMQTADAPEVDQSIDGLLADTWRARLGLEASRRFSIGQGGVLAPFVEVAARRDGGDGVTGTGLEVAGGVRYTESRLALEARGRLLAVHTEAGVQESGLSVTARLTPQPDGSGLSLSLSPRVGVATGGADALWGDAMPRLAASAGDDAVSLDGSIGYGFASPGALITPFAEGSVAGGDRRMRAGVSFDAPATGLHVQVYGERRESLGAVPHHALALSVQLRY